MAEKKVKSIIPDVPLYGNPHTQAKTGGSASNVPAKKGPVKPRSSLKKSAVKKPFADPKTGKITAPSAVNMQDIKIYVCTKDGVCLFNAKDNLLIKVSDKDLRDAIAGRQSFAKTAPVSLVLVSTKDSERAPNDRYGAMDAGYVSQNIYLACTALGLKTVARATMDFDTLKRELNLADTSYLELNHPISY